MIRVLLADDQELVRSGFRALIDAQDDLTVVGEASTGSQAVELAYTHQPDVILMDIRMPQLDGIAATSRISADPRLERTRVLILTTFDLDQYVYNALRAGASGFLLKDTAPGQLLDAIRIVDAGEALIAPSITRRLISEFAARPDPATADDILGPLTDREREILTEVGQRPQQRRDRREALYQSPDRQDPRQPDHGQAPCSRSGPARGHCLRNRARRARLSWRRLDASRIQPRE